MRRTIQETGISTWVGDISFSDQAPDWRDQRVLGGGTSTFMNLGGIVGSVEIPF